MRNPYSHNKRCLCGKLIQNNSKACDKCTHFGSTNPNYKDGRTLKTYYCQCGRKICYNNWFEGEKTCKSCAQLGDKNDNYTNGLSRTPYPKGWTRQLKASIRKRDNYTCQNCRTSEKEHVAVYGFFLEVHHIDYCKENCHHSNLITLCKLCNIRANRNRKSWQELYTAQMKTKELIKDYK